MTAAAGVYGGHSRWSISLSILCPLRCGGGGGGGGGGRRVWYVSGDGQCPLPLSKNHHTTMYIPRMQDSVGPSQLVYIYQ